MTNQRNHRKSNKQISRSDRNQVKLQRIHKRMREATQNMAARFQTRLGWWQRTFRIPTLLNSAAFSKASSLWLALMALVGMQHKTPGMRLKKRSTDLAKRKRCAGSNPSRDRPRNQELRANGPSPIRSPRQRIVRGTINYRKPFRLLSRTVFGLGVRTMSVRVCR